MHQYALWLRGAAVVVPLFFGSMAAAQNAAKFGPETSARANGQGTAPQISAQVLGVDSVSASPAPRLELAVTGDIDGSSETILVQIGGVDIGTITGGADTGGGGQGSSIGCSTTYSQTLPLPDAAITALNNAVKTGSVLLDFIPSAPVGNICGATGSNFAFIVSGALVFTPAAPAEPAGGGPAALDQLAIDATDVKDETATDAAQNVATVRGGLTVANLPTLSGRFGGGGGSTSSLSGGGDPQAGALNFSTSLAALRNAASSDDVNQGGVAAAFHAEPGVGAVDVWVGGSYTYFQSDLAGATSDGGVGVAQIGVDMRVGERLLVGLMAMGDLLNSNVSGGAKADGFGFLAGPYAVARLSDDIYLEGLAAFGMSFNQIDTAGAASVADYDSQRMLLTARLSGNFDIDRFSLTPSARLTYYADKQAAFIDGNGAPVPENTTLLGQVRFGPEVSYAMTLGDDSSIRPYAAVEGVYSFMRNDQVINGAAITPDELSATASAGFDLSLGGAAIRAGARYDGVGTDQFEAITGEVQVRLPLN